MSLSLDENRSNYQIRAYKPGHIQVNDLIYTQSIIIAPTVLLENWQPQSITELNASVLAPIAALKPTVLLIGTGSKHELLPVEYYGELINQGIGVEIMDTAAACRTYNALSAENRNVVAALLIK